jgi:hypothetical protein
MGGRAGRAGALPSPVVVFFPAAGLGVGDADRDAGGDSTVTVLAGGVGDVTTGEVVLVAD